MKADHAALEQRVDYTPLDLSDACNVGVSFLGPLWRMEKLSNGWDTPTEFIPPLGMQSFHGLPFQIGPRNPDPTRCFLGWDADHHPAITIQVGDEVKCIVFAHALLDEAMPNESAFQTVATYLIRFSDGSEVEVSVRDRFEVALAPNPWQPPFLALAATPSEERIFTYSLWSWENPHPTVAIDSITVRPANRRFIVAGITLGYIGDYPFRRGGTLPIKITLRDEGEARRPMCTHVAVDRGIVTAPRPLPVESRGSDVSDPMKGWGQEANLGSSPIYVEADAVPSATLVVRYGEKGDVARVNWGDLTRQRRVERLGVAVEVLEEGRNWVRTTVLDDETGNKLPCRIHFSSLDGVPYQPHGHHDNLPCPTDAHPDVGGDVRLGQLTYAYINGDCEGWLPKGPIVIDVARGFEYEPLRLTTDIGRGQQDLVLRLKRWTNMRQEGWHSGDTHVHFLSANGALLEAQGEDLAVLNLLQMQAGPCSSLVPEFAGEPVVSSDGQTLVYCSQENRQHVLGHLSLLGLRRPVLPMATGEEEEHELGGRLSGGTLEDVLARWADACHEQGGTVVIPHHPIPEGEQAALIATGRADAIELGAHVDYYRYLRAGYQLPLVGGTDKMGSDVPVGITRTYANIPPDEPFTFDAWCNAVKAGRTFVTSGPLVDLKVEGRSVGETVAMPGPGTIEVEASARSIFPMKSLELVEGGRVVASAEDLSGAQELHLKASVRIEDHTWLAARCGGARFEFLPPNYWFPSYRFQTAQGVLRHFDGLRRPVSAHTSPVYVAVKDEWAPRDQESWDHMMRLIEGSLSYIRSKAAQYRAETTLHHHGTDDHLAYLEAPLLDAKRVLAERMKGTAGD